MVEIGAGGGSLAHVDSMRQIRVGPESAGSEPGPACYGRGGEKPAVTDADLLLGKLDPEEFAGGSIALDKAQSEKALQQHIGTTLDMPALEAAWGLAEVVDENMANAARVHAVENGEDLSEYTMIAFGGAAPLHAVRLADKLGISRCLVPAGAGVGSAIGFLRAPFSFEANRSVFMRLGSFDSALARSLFQEMQEEATSFVKTCDAKAEILLDFKIYMRYSGQGWEIPVPITAAQAATPDADEYLKLFEQHYEQLFGRSVEGLDTEITVWSANAHTPPQPVEPLPQVRSMKVKAANATRTLFDPASGVQVEATVVERAELKAGAFIDGPALITEDETTVVALPDTEVHTCADGTLLIDRETAYE